LAELSGGAAILSSKTTNKNTAIRQALKAFGPKCRSDFCLTEINRCHSFFVCQKPAGTSNDNQASFLMHGNDLIF